MEIFKTKGVCATEIHFEIEEGVITDIAFVRGCPGNTLGLSALVKGMRVEDAITKLEGIDCGGKGTSCPDQLTKALKNYMAN